jgi:hypothetical protein
MGSYDRQVRVALITVAAMLALVLPGTAAATIPSGNLVVNGGAEVGPSSAVENRQPIPGWATATGPVGFMAIDYVPPGTASVLMHADSPGAAGCRGFFGGGHAAGGGSAVQTVNVSGAAAEIDAGSVNAGYSARLGALSGVADHGEVVFSFRDGAGLQLLARTLTGTSPPASSLEQLADSELVPIGTRSIQVTAAAADAGAIGNFAYLDNIALTLDGSPPSAGSPPVGCGGGTAVTGAATEVTSTGATISGIVDPRLDQGRYRFEYGTTTAYGQVAGAGVATPIVGQPIPMIAPPTATLTGLQPDTTYHYRLVAEWPKPEGGAYIAPTAGADITFRTLPRSVADVPKVVPTARRVSIRYSARKGTLSGRISSSAPACRKDKVEVFRDRKKGRDPKVASAQADAKGRWKVSKDLAEGRYYAKVAGGASCAGAKSGTIAIGLTRSPASD